jgi:hypothetical protein
VHSAGAGRSVQGMQICTVKGLRSRKRRLFLGFGMLDWDSNAAVGAYHKASRQHAANTVSCGEAFHHLASVGLILEATYPQFTPFVSICAGRFHASSH